MAKHSSFRQLNIEQLESRELLAADFVFAEDSGRLTITGTDGDDTVVVSVADDQLRLQVDGVEVNSIPRDRVSEVHFRGRGGNDRFENHSNVRSVAYGNEGNDYLLGGDANDSLFGGPGNDQALKIHGATLVLGIVRILGVADSTLDHFFQHSGTAMGLVPQNIERFIRESSTYHIRQRTNLARADACVTL